MINYNLMDDRLVIFGSIFTVSNRLQLLLNHQMPDISAKQWFVLAMLSFFDSPPHLTKLAGVCDCSYQNVKQIVLNLEEKGFVRLEEDAKDKRAKNVVMTDKFEEWNAKTREQSIHFVDTLFKPLSEAQIKEFKNLLLTIYERLGEMQNAKKD